LPFAALAVLGAFLVGGAFNSAPRAEANIGDIATSAQLTEGDNEVTITIETEDDLGPLVVEVSGDGDFEVEDPECDEDCPISDESSSGFTVDTDSDDIDVDDNQDGLTVTFTLIVECEEDDEIVIEAADEEDSDDLELVCGAGVTPTVGAAATVVAQASPSTVNCNGTSIVTIQVKGANGQPVAVGTNVTIQASIGSVSPSSGQTTSADGSVFVFYTAPSNAGGAATITARAGNAQGTATVTVNCAAPAPTTAPPPPTVSPGVITPPSTGDAGIGSDRTDWTPFAGIAAIVATLVGGAFIAVKTRE
jgi:hypothetical protein